MGGRPTVPSRVGSSGGRESAVPAEHGDRLDDEEHLGESVAVDGLGKHCEDRAVGVGEPRPLDMALQDEDLVPQGQDLGVAAVTGHYEQSDGR